MFNFYKVLIGIIIILSAFQTEIYSQNFKNISSGSNQNSIDTIRTLKGKKVKAGGVFITPLGGLEFPFKDFGDKSRSGFTYGAKLDFAHSIFYPFIVGLIYQYQKNKGNEEYLTVNRLDYLETTINSFGGSVDLILNKYLKSNFTVPFFTLEIKYMSIKRNLSPFRNELSINAEDNIIGITAGLGFTIYIFDLYGSYTYAKNFMTFGLKTRFHFPLIKF